MARPAISVTEPGMNSSRPDAIRIMRSMIFSRQNSQPWNPPEMTAVPINAVRKTDRISGTDPCIIMAGL